MRFFEKPDYAAMVDGSPMSEWDKLSAKDLDILYELRTRKEHELLCTCTALERQAGLADVVEWRIRTNGLGPPDFVREKYFAVQDIELRKRLIKADRNMGYYLRTSRCYRMHETKAFFEKIQSRVPLPSWSWLIAAGGTAWLSTVAPPWAVFIFSLIIMGHAADGILSRTHRVRAVENIYNQAHAAFQKIESEEMAFNSEEETTGEPFV